MQILGVFENIYGTGAEMTMGQTLLISVVGFAIVFLVLGFLAVFVFCMGKVFDILQSKKTAKEEAPVSSPASAPAEKGVALPSNQSIGDLTLINTSESEAAAVMAIVSAKSGIPLNRLKFNTIKYLEDKKQ